MGDPESKLEDGERREEVGQARDWQRPLTEVSPCSGSKVESVSGFIHCGKHWSQSKCIIRFAIKVTRGMEVAINSRTSCPARSQDFQSRISQAAPSTRVTTC